MSNILKPGDLVVLKSGGPWMTVHRVESDATVTCMWFPAADSVDPFSMLPVYGELCAADFNSTMLLLIPEKTS